MKKSKKKIHPIKRIFIVLALVLVVGFVILHQGRQVFYEKAEAKQSASTAQTSLPTILKDSKSGLSLSIQLVEGQQAVGTFDLFVPDQGFYHGVVPVGQSSYHVFHPDATISVMFYPFDDSLPVSRSVRIKGQIDISDNSSTINFWINKKQFNLISKKADDSSFTQTAEGVATSFESENWSSLYDVLSSEIKETMTETQLSDLMNNSSPEIIAVDLNGKGETHNVSGNTYETQPVVLTVQDEDGTTSQFHSNLFFVWENDTWKLLSTDTPQE